jgi:hypothetical protein
MPQDNSHFRGTNIQSGFSVSVLFSAINNASVSAKTKLSAIRGRTSAISIGDMFEMQMLMNHLSQLSDMASSVVSASNTALQKMSGAISR